MTWQQFLTQKVLKEHWHDLRIDVPWVRCACGKDWFGTTEDSDLKKHQNRTFDNRNDLMDLYEVLDSERKWESFKSSLFELSLKGINDSWIFCFNRKSNIYEDRCKMVAEFYGWEEGK